MIANLKSRLPQIITELPPEVGEAIERGCEIVAADAASRVNPGPPDIHLAERIHVEKRGDTEYAVVGGDGDAFYGHIVEHGSVKSAPHPFLVPALDAHAEEIVGMVAAIVRRL